jgi:hypothetical protein
MEKWINESLPSGRQLGASKRVPFEANMSNPIQEVRETTHMQRLSEHVQDISILSCQCQVLVC